MNLKKSAFTFVETLVVVAIFAITSVILFSSFTSGMKIWKNSASFNYGERKTMLGLERLSKELRQATNYPLIGFWGEPVSVNFANIADEKIWNISYSYNNAKGCVERASSFFAPPDAETVQRTQVIMPSVKDFTLSFYGYSNETNTTAFMESWNYTTFNSTPKAVKARVVNNDGKIFEKIITI